MVYRRRKNVTTKRRLGRRWYATAKTPFGSFTAGNQPVSRMSKRDLTQTIKRVARNVEEDKEIVRNLSGTNVKHATVYTYNPFARIVESSSVSGQTRESDEIHIKNGIRGRFRYTAEKSLLPSGSSNSYARLLFVASSKEVDPSSTFWGTGLGSTEIFYDPNTPELSMVDPKKVSILYEHMFKLTGSNDTGSVERHFDFFIPFDKTLKFKTDALSPYMRIGKNYYFILIAGTPGGTIGTTTLINSSNLQTIIKFTDGK